jgi:hypothetical protein
MSSENTAIAAAVALCAALFAAPVLIAADSPSYGAPIIEKSIKVQDPQPPGEMQKGARFVSSRNYAETLKFYRKLWRGNDNIEFRKIATTPNVKAVYIINKDMASAWEGINIYEIKGETRIFVLPRIRTVDRK